MLQRLEEAAAAEGAEDRISDLNDDLLHRVLSSLPAHEAVRTCVLSRRWRGVWKSLPVLRVTDALEWESPAKFNKFVNHLLVFRDVAPLQEFSFETYLFKPQIASDLYRNMEEPARYLDMWIRYALLREVRVLRVNVKYAHSHPRLVNTRFVSQRLKTVELVCLVFDGRSLDFSECPLLEDLELRDCKISVQKISSPSLRRLCLNRCTSQSHVWTRISAPNVSSLRLDVDIGRVPLLQSMPLLVTACVRLRTYCQERCWRKEMKQCGSESCVDCYDSNGSCVILGALSNATDLELAAGMLGWWEHSAAADMRLCPTFSKLKTLVLHNWVVASKGDDVLTRFLQHAPILEKISLGLFQESEYISKIEECCSMLEQIMLPSEHLKTIEVSCTRGSDLRVAKLVKFLNSRGAAVEAELPEITLPEDLPASEREMILQRCLQHHQANGTGHVVAKWTVEPALRRQEKALPEAGDCPAARRASKRTRRANSLFPDSVWSK